MTTAGRPTWNAAIGSGSRVQVPSKQYSSRDLRGHTKLKQRQIGQNSIEELKQRDLKKELVEREKKKNHTKEEEEIISLEENNKDIKLLEETKIEKKELIKNIDADDTDDSSDSSESESESEQEEEDTAELMKELERIKKEREEELKKKEIEEKQIKDIEQENSALTSNPLLNVEKQDFTIKKRWYEDTIFKNQAKIEIKQQKRFINDTVRNDFHRKFLNKYIK